MNEYGLVGKKLSHSFSKPIHESFSRYSYELIEVSPDEIKDFFKSRNFKGVNVTVPYKKEALASADVVDESAMISGSSNCLVNRNGILTAYNTDLDGIASTFKKHGIDLKEKKILILGNGGVASAIESYVKHAGARDVLKVYYKKSPETITYDDVFRSHLDADILINGTPVGTHPNLDQSPIDISEFTNLEFVFDVIYNPFETKLLQQARKKGIPYSNGLWMLVVQAFKAAEHFLDEKLDKSLLNDIYLDLLKQQANIALIGMPSSGKTTISKEIGDAFNKPVVDLDELIIKAAGMSIPEIFDRFEESGFRAMESQAAKDAARRHGSILSCGGGIVIKDENMDVLSQNAAVVYIDRDLELLTSEDDNRPMLKHGLEKLYEARKERYEKNADYVLKNNGSLEDAVNELVQAAKSEDLYARFK